MTKISILKERGHKGIIMVLLILYHSPQRDKNVNDKKARIKKGEGAAYSTYRNTVVKCDSAGDLIKIEIVFC